MPSDAADLARVIITLLEDTESRGRMAAHGHALVRRRHLADQMAAEHEDLYHEIMLGRR